MPKKAARTKPAAVTIRVRVGDAEIEVTGPTEFVKAQVNDFLKHPPALASRSTERGSSAPPSQTSVKAKSPAEFFKMSNPTTDVDRTLVAAYFLEKYRNAQDASGGEIKAVIKEAKRSPPTNINDAVNRNIRKGLMMTAGDRENKMVFVLTSDGEAAVDQMVANVKA